MLIGISGVVARALDEGCGSDLACVRMHKAKNFDEACLVEIRRKLQADRQAWI